MRSLYADWEAVAPTCVALLRREAAKSRCGFSADPSPLELFFDLTRVVAMSFVATELHHALAEGHAAQAVVGYVIVFFGSGGPGPTSPGSPPSTTPTMCPTGC